ncbi:MAG: thiamine phosphate synthase [Epsilonproteobacteria bacterium]|nr:thiamine phosphate synthase [Campylobacterota bacterium]
MTSYLITDPQFYDNRLYTFENYLEKIYQKHSVDYSCLRDKTSLHLAELADSFLQLSQKYNIKKTLINGDVKLAKSMGFYGVHLTSMQFNLIKEAKALGLFVVVSTHSKEEALAVEILGADAITFSPIFETPNKGAPKGIDALSLVANALEIKTFALGGIVSDTEVQKCENSGAYGFASIRYFLT